MNAKDAVALLQPLEGHHLLILKNEEHGYLHGQPCIRVHHLLPDQRQPDQGNIILWDGRFTSKGLQSGGTFWAKDIRSIAWWGGYRLIAHIRTRQGARISFLKLWELSHDKQEGDRSK